MHGGDGLGGINLPRAQLPGGHGAEKGLWETFRANPREVTIITMGPLTNLSRLLRRDPSIADIIDRVIISGGTQNNSNWSNHAQHHMCQHVIGKCKV
jgi:purine nucleosidase